MQQHIYIPHPHQKMLKSAERKRAEHRAKVVAFNANVAKGPAGQNSPSKWGLTFHKARRINKNSATRAVRKEKHTKVSSKSRRNGNKKNNSASRKNKNS